MPQWDEQLLGTANVLNRGENYEMLPRPNQVQPSNLSSCDRCQLTWPVGNAGLQAAASHPSHHTLAHRYAGTRRSLLVHTDGACVNNGQSNPRAGVGIYFGPNSRYNLSKPLDDESSPTNQKAELEAILRAMQIVREQIVGTRANFVNGNSDKQHFRLVIVTDSSYAVECLCKHWKNWEESNSRPGILLNKEGRPIMNSGVFLRIKEELERLSHVGVQVVYYHVRREFNREADALAKDSVATNLNRHVQTVMVGHAGAIF